MIAMTAAVALAALEWLVFSRLTCSNIDMLPPYLLYT
jgi:hypothetical protein